MSTVGIFSAGADAVVTPLYVPDVRIVTGEGGGGGGLTAEQVRDIIGAALVEGANVDITVDDAADQIRIAVTGLAPVAASGSYSDLDDRPTIPAGYSDDQATAAAAAALSDGDHTGITFVYDEAAGTISAMVTVTGDGGITEGQVATLIGAAMSGLADVAATGSYLDLADRPTIPSTPGDVGAQPAGDYIVDADLAAVATSGSYDDLDDTPTIPSGRLSDADDVDTTGAAVGKVVAVTGDDPALTYGYRTAVLAVGTPAAPVTDNATTRPDTSGPVYWVCAADVTPTNAADGDLIWNQD